MYRVYVGRRAVRMRGFVNLQDCRCRTPGQEQRPFESNGIFGCSDFPRTAAASANEMRRRQAHHKNTHQHHARFFIACSPKGSLSVRRDPGTCTTGGSSFSWVHSMAHAGCPSNPDEIAETNPRKAASVSGERRFRMLVRIPTEVFQRR